jgi:hypothetical protein
MKKKVIIPIIVLLILIILIFSFINNEKQILFIEYHIDFSSPPAYFSMHGAMSAKVEYMLLLHYKNKLSSINYTWDKSDDEIYNKTNPEESCIFNEFTKNSDNKDLLQLVSNVNKDKYSFVITSDLKRFKDDNVEVIFYVIDLKGDCQVFEIKTRRFDVQNINEYIEIQTDKIAKEIIKVIDKNNSILPW